MSTPSSLHTAIPGFSQPTFLAAKWNRNKRMANSGLNDSRMFGPTYSLSRWNEGTRHFLPFREKCRCVFAKFKIDPPARPRAARVCSRRAAEDQGADQA